MKTIGDRISYSEKGHSLVIAIKSKTARWQESLLMAWVVAWTLSGGYYIYEMSTGDYAREERLMFFVLISFWLYFEIKIGKVFLWRKYGKEFIRVTADKLTLKRDIRSYGKAHHYFLDNISNVDLIPEQADKSLSKQYENSFWVMGGETIVLNHNGKLVKLGLRLEQEEAKQLLRLLRKTIRQRKKEEAAEVVS